MTIIFFILLFYHITNNLIEKLYINLKFCNLHCRRMQIEKKFSLLKEMGKNEII